MRVIIHGFPRLLGGSVVVIFASMFYVSTKIFFANKASLFCLASRLNVLFSHYKSVGHNGLF